MSVPEVRFTFALAKSIPTVRFTSTTREIVYLRLVELGGIQTGHDSVIWYIGIFGILFLLRIFISDIVIFLVFIGILRVLLRISSQLLSY